MAEYIEREATIELYCQKCKGYYDGHCIHRGECDVDVIQTAPAADVQPVKRGHWIEHEKFERKNCNVCIECSVCNTWFGHDAYPKTKFCPNCGADMRGEEQ